MVWGLRKGSFIRAFIEDLEKSKRMSSTLMDLALGEFSGAL